MISKKNPEKIEPPRGGNHDKNLKFFHRVGVQPTIKWIKATQLFKIFLALLKENWWGCTGSNRVHKKFKNQNRLGLRSTQFINRLIVYEMLLSITEWTLCNENNLEISERSWAWAVMWIARSVAINNTHMVHSSVLHYITDMLSSENSRCLHCPRQTSVRGHNYRVIQRKDSEDCVINNSITI